LALGSWLLALGFIFYQDMGGSGKVEASHYILSQKKPHTGYTGCLFAFNEEVSDALNREVHYETLMV
jgi:hypothetical protein